MGRKKFCRHLDTVESILELKVMQKSTVESRYSHEYVTHRFTNGMHTLLIHSHSLCIRYSYARIRYAYVAHTTAFVMHT